VGVGVNVGVVVFVGEGISVCVDAIGGVSEGVVTAWVAPQAVNKIVERLTIRKRLNMLPPTILH
jgi:hypothetical protein